MIDPHQQCLNCCFVNSRRCVYHGYPDNNIPPQCMYKIGTSAFEAQENWQGTHLEWKQLKEHDSKILDTLFPPNTKLHANGDLHGGWELDPKPLFKLKKAIEANLQYTEEPEAEVIEVVVLAIKRLLKYGEKK